MRSWYCVKCAKSPNCLSLLSKEFLEDGNIDNLVLLYFNAWECCDPVIFEMDVDKVGVQFLIFIYLFISFAFVGIVYKFTARISGVDT